MDYREWLCGFRTFSFGRVCAKVHPEYVDDFLGNGVLDVSFYRRYSGLHRRGEGLLLDMGGRRVVLKVYRRGGVLGPLLGSGTLDGERSFRELAFYVYLQGVGGLAPLPCGAVSISCYGGVVYRHLLLTRYLEGCWDLVEFFSRFPELFLDCQEGWLVGLARALADLHNLGVYHGDLNARNILLGYSGDRFRVYFIDFDGSFYSSSLGVRERLKNLSRLYRSYCKLRYQGRLPEISGGMWRLFWEVYRDCAGGLVGLDFGRVGGDYFFRRLFWRRR